MPFAVVEMAFDLYRQTAYPLPQIQLVGALVQKNSSALTRPGCTPVSRIIVCLRAVPVGDYPVGAADLSVNAGLHKLTHFAIYAVGTLIEHHAENCVRVLFGFFVHAADV